MIEPFKDKITITKPLLPDINKVIKEIQDIWERKWLTNMGPKHEHFEEMLRNYLKVPYIQLVCNGTIALEIAIQALELKGEIITTPFTFAATINSIVNKGCEPVFCDIDLKSYNLDVNLIESKITSKTVAIMPVHVFGNPAKPDLIDEIAKKHNLKVIYDAAHCFGVSYKDRSIGTYGDISTFSFHATKIFNSIEGGALSFNDSKLYRKTYLLKNFGIENEEEVSIPGTNGKMNEIQAAIGILNLEKVDNEIKKREKLFKHYIELLQEFNGITTLEYEKGTTPNYQYFPILIDKKKFGIDRNQLYEYMRKYNVYPRKYFHPIASKFKYLKNFSFKDISNAQYVGDNILCLPIYGELNCEDVDKIVEIIKISAKNT